MKKLITGMLLAICTLNFAVAQTTTTTVTPINQGGYDSKTLVDTNSTSTSVSTVNSNSTTNNTSTSTNNSTVNSTSTNTNVNQNINSGTMTYNNNNVSTATNINQNINSGTMTYNNNNNTVSTNTNYSYGTMTNNNNNVNTSTSTNTNLNKNESTSTATNINVNSGTMTYNNNNASTSTNNNNNVNTSTATNVNQNIQSGSMTNINRNDSTITQKVVQPPPTAIAPAMMSAGSDLCVTGVSGAAQTQILGISLGGTQRDYNCERLKLSKTMFDMGMKVAAVAVMCQDRRVFDAMMQAGTPCPYEGQIGEQAKVAWMENPHKMPKPVKE